MSTAEAAQKQRRSSANQRKVRIQNLKLVKSNNNIIINHAKTKKKTILMFEI